MVWTLDKLSLFLGELRRVLLLTSLAATSNDAWGPTGTDMAEIAALTFNRFVQPFDSPFFVCWLERSLTY